MVINHWVHAKTGSVCASACRPTIYHHRITLIKERRQCPVCDTLLTFRRNVGYYAPYATCVSCGASQYWLHTHSEHISKYWHLNPRRVLVCGKGSSLEYWESVPNIDEYICCNEAVEVVRRGIFTRYNANQWFSFCASVPPSVTTIMPQHNRELYNYGYWFDWKDLGMQKGAATGVMAIYLARWLGASEIILIGFDALQYGDHSYYVSNSRNREHGAADQTDQFARIDESFNLSYWDGESYD